MTNWYWIRHAPTNLKGLVGWSDVEVDLSNIDMFARLNNYLPKDLSLIHI